MTDKTEAIAKLRHLYDNLAHGGVRDTSQAKRIAEGLLAPAIEALEVELRRQHAETEAQADRIASLETQLSQAQAVPMLVTEEMHVAACKVLQRANGLDGLPQRMLDAMLAASPTPPPTAFKERENEFLGMSEVRRNSRNNKLLHRLNFTKGKRRYYD